MKTSNTRLAGASRLALVVSLLTALGTSRAVAQQTTEANGPGQEIENIVVTGTRRGDLAAAESPTPISIVSSEDLLSEASADLNDVLRKQVPSFNVQRLVTNDGAVFTRPFSLRGLPPDHTLVLVNGKRRHRGATVQFTNVPYLRGSQGADLAAIPAIAIGQLEVLRDGASALYGSDAIAGVLNFRLRTDDEGAMLIGRYGQYSEGDGDDILLQGNIGLPFTDAGFFNVSGEYANSDPTSRGIQRPDAQALIDAGVPRVPVPAQRWGNPASEAVRLFVNSALDLTDTMEAYAFGNYSWSEGTTGFFYRHPETSFLGTSVPLTDSPGGPRFTFSDEIFPGGYAPNFGATIRDLSLVGGARGEGNSGLTWDLSTGYGENSAEYSITNTVNPSLGPDSPTAFKPGTLEQRELNVNFDTAYPVDLGLADPLNLAGGLEYRRETYEIGIGDVASWEVGPFASLIDPDTGLRTGLPVGSNGFPGFSPSQAGEFSRENWAVYGALEGDLTDWLLGGVAVRYEDFSDFGSTFNWKINARVDFSDTIGVRAAVSTGFRAPTPGQANASNVSTNIDSVTGAPLTSGIVGPANQVAQFFGATPLDPEESFNVAAGIVLAPMERMTITLDYFNIEVDDRIALSGNFALTQEQRDQLAALGIPGGGSFQQLAFFTNSFDSQTRGFDAMLNWGFDLAGGVAAFSSNLNYTDTKVTRATAVIAADRERLLELEDFVPEWKGNIQFDFEGDRFSFVTRATYYGEWTDYASTPDGDQSGGEEVFLDAEVSYRLTDIFRIAAGAENILDNYPDVEIRQSQINNGIKYLRFAPTGFNGSFWYVRATATF